MRKYLKISSIFLSFIILGIYLMSCAINDEQSNLEPIIYFGGYYVINNVVKAIKSTDFSIKPIAEEQYTSCYWKLEKGELTRKDIVNVNPNANVELMPWIYVKDGTVYYPGVKTEYNDSTGEYEGYAYYWTIDSEGNVTEKQICTNLSDAYYVTVGEDGIVYVAGAIGEQACYWKIDGDKIDENLFNDGSDAIHLDVLNDKIFLVGRETTEQAQYAHYWVIENGNELISQRINPEGSSMSSCIGSYLKGEKLYISGYYQSGINLACYWVVDTNSLYNLLKTVELPDDEGGEDSFAFNIYVNNDEIVYIAGNSSDGHPCYWVDDGSGNLTQHILNKDLDGYAIAIWEMNNKLYISGQYTTIDPDTENEQQIGCYWIVDLNTNNIEKSSFSENNAAVWSIFVE